MHPLFEGNLGGFFSKRKEELFPKFIDILTDSVAFVRGLYLKGYGPVKRAGAIVQINKQHPSRNNKRTWTELGLDLLRKGLGYLPIGTVFKNLR